MNIIASTEEIGLRVADLAPGSARKTPYSGSVPRLVGDYEVAMGGRTMPAKGLQTGGKTLLMSESGLAMLDTLSEMGKLVVVSPEALQSEEEVEAWRSILRKRFAMVAGAGKEVFMNQARQLKQELGAEGEDAPTKAWESRSIRNVMARDTAWEGRVKAANKAGREVQTEEALTYVLPEDERTSLSDIFAEIGGLGENGKPTGFAKIDEALAMTIARLRNA